MRLYSVDLIMTRGPVNYLYKGCVDSTNPPRRGSNRSNSYHPCSLSFRLSSCPSALTCGTQGCFHLFPTLRDPCPARPVMDVIGCSIRGNGRRMLTVARAWDASSWAGPLDFRHLCFGSSGYRGIHYTYGVVGDRGEGWIEG